MTPPPVQALLLDLDGLLLDTETLCVQVAREVVARHGKALTLDAQRAALGKRPLECWADVVQILGLEASPQQLLDESEPLMAARWADAPLMPGALRLVRHLAARGVPFAVATSTPRATFNAKMAAKAELRALLGGDGAAAPVAVVCGDEVERGKPHPDVFLAAASRLGVAPEQCLVLEDAPSGAQGATAAGMRVVVVPSLLDASAYDPPEPAARQGVVEHLPSLLAFRPQRYGLPAFGDRLGAAAAGQGPAGEAQGQAQGGGGGGGPAGAEAEEDGVIPMDRVIRIKGKVVKGFGRGSKELGIPTANVDPAAVHAALADAVTGIYAGWARLGSGPEVYKTDPGGPYPREAATAADRQAQGSPPTPAFRSSSSAWHEALFAMHLRLCRERVRSCLRSCPSATTPSSPTRRRRWSRGSCTPLNSPSTARSCVWWWWATCGPRPTSRHWRRWWRASTPTPTSAAGHWSWSRWRASRRTPSCWPATDGGWGRARGGGRRRV